MLSVPHSRSIGRLLTLPVKRALSLLIAIAQLAVAVAPALHAKLGSDTKAHFENGGTRLHYTHDETACPSCSPPHSDVPAQAPPPADTPRQVMVHGTRDIGPVAASPLRTANPRAPPIVDRAG